MAGSVNKVTLNSTHEIARFFSQVDVGRVDDCWNWQGMTNNNGYGRFSLKDKHRMAHRLSMEYFSGGISEDLNVCHHCDNRLCVNPNHLFLGTQSDNLKDAAAKGGMYRPDTRGHRNGNTKLTVSDVCSIRSKLSAGIQQKHLAKAYGVHPETISNIKTRKTWSE